MDSRWAYLLIGALGGYMLARSGGSTGAGLSFSIGAGAHGAPPGGGTTPLDQPNGAHDAPYQTVGAWDPQLPGGSFEQYIPNNGNAVILDGGGDV